MVDCDNCKKDMYTFTKWKLTDYNGLSVYNFCSLACLDEYIHNHLGTTLKFSKGVKKGELK